MENENEPHHEETSSTEAPVDRPQVKEEDDDEVTAMEEEQSVSLTEKVSFSTNALVETESTEAEVRSIETPPESQSPSLLDTNRDSVVIDPPSAIPTDGDYHHIPVEEEEPSSVSSETPQAVASSPTHEDSIPPSNPADDVAFGDEHMVEVVEAVEVEEVPVKSAIASSNEHPFGELETSCQIEVSPVLVHPENKTDEEEVFVTPTVTTEIHQDIPFASPVPSVAASPPSIVVEEAPLDAQIAASPVQSTPTAEHPDTDELIPKVSLPHKYATVDYRRAGGKSKLSDANESPSKANGGPATVPVTTPLLRRRSHDDIANLLRDSFRLDLNHNLREMDEALKQAACVQKKVVNDDDKFPDSVTPSKVDHSLSQQGYDVPFIDDAAFYYKEWYVMEDHCWSRIDVSEENGTTEKEVVPATSHAVKSTKKKNTPMLASNESISKKAKPKGLFRFCGCVGRRK